MVLSFIARRIFGDESNYAIATGLWIGEGEVGGWEEEEREAGEDKCPWESDRINKDGLKGVYGFPYFI